MSQMLFDARPSSLGGDDPCPPPVTKGPNGVVGAGYQGGRGSQIEAETAAASRQAWPASSSVVRLRSYESQSTLICDPEYIYLYTPASTGPNGPPFRHRAFLQYTTHCGTLTRLTPQGTLYEKASIGSPNPSSRTPSALQTSTFTVTGTDPRRPTQRHQPPCALGMKINTHHLMIALFLCNWRAPQTFA